MVSFTSFNFNPSDQEIIFYLNRKIDNLPIPPNTFENRDTFLDPQSLDWSEVWYLKPNQRFYFTKRTPLSNKIDAKRVKRSGELGFWRAATSEKKIFDHHDQVVGFVSQLEFFTYNDDRKSCGNCSKTRWIMHEYRLPSDTFQEWVVSRIKNDAKDSSKLDAPEAKRRRVDQEQELQLHYPQQMFVDQQPFSEQQQQQQPFVDQQKQQELSEQCFADNNNNNVRFYEDGTGELFVGLSDDIQQPPSDNDQDPGALFPSPYM